ncbi:MAG: UDP-N-acetylmuramoyl-L-alanine--D-glutamate ligase [Dehalococcoidia bacterium]|nr:UDP-N-acetylmuramoyl-L-alanine--D-glutamate ligase [Dehalococcoidia bacterium]MYI86233.1 UDP-N-acetylmuramoyl-L-alanine--D-glutamate ligase [Dehalococcoidia bacterium]
MMVEHRTAAELPEIADARALVYSLGIEGRDLARWLLARGASVTMADSRTEQQLEAAGATPPDGVERTVRGELLDPEGFDLLAVSQSVLRDHLNIVRAHELGIPVVSQLALALRLCRGRVVGVTGSSGKSTTTALVGAMAERAGIDHLVGGNLGGSLLDRIEAVAETTSVILEMSHTQLQYTDRSPAIAAVTNITPNHLDQFSWPDYVDLKRSILQYQDSDGLAILNADDETSRELRADVRGRLAEVSLAGPVAGDGAWLEGDAIMSRRGGAAERVASTSDLRLRGRHNVANAVLAVAIAGAMGLSREAIADTLGRFPGLPHRLQVVGRAHGAVWINDSISTSPERAVAALEAVTEPAILLLGGREKDLPLDKLRATAGDRCRAAVCFGEAATPFAEAMAGAVETVVRVETLDEAVAAAATIAREGDVVLLSPAGTSFDAYPRFEARGEAFAALVAALEGFEEVSP